jgi:hypothetical protein
MPVGWPEQGRFRMAELVLQFATSVADGDERQGQVAQRPARRA